MPKTSQCPDCKTTRIWHNCQYPFWYHEGSTPRHGDWTPEHGCVADASKAKPTDRSDFCGS